MKIWMAALVLTVAGCSNDSMTRQFGVVRDAAPNTVSAAMPPLSTPPPQMQRPERAGRFTSDTAPAPSPKTPLSAGQNALLDASGPAAPGDIRQQVDANSGSISLGPGFAEQVMNWSPPPGYTPLAAPTQRGWLSRLF